MVETIRSFNSIEIFANPKKVTHFPPTKAVDLLLVREYKFIDISRYHGKRNIDMTFAAISCLYMFSKKFELKMASLSFDQNNR
jgi:hypothetical protein